MTDLNKQVNAKIIFWFDILKITTMCSSGIYLFEVWVCFVCLPTIALPFLVYVIFFLCTGCLKSPVTLTLNCNMRGTKRRNWITKTVLLQCGAVLPTRKLCNDILVLPATRLCYFRCYSPKIVILRWRHKNLIYCHLTFQTPCIGPVW